MSPALSRKPRSITSRCALVIHWLLNSSNTLPIRSFASMNKSWLHIEFHLHNREKYLLMYSIFPYTDHFQNALVQGVLCVSISPYVCIRCAYYHCLSDHNSNTSNTTCFITFALTARPLYDTFRAPYFRLALVGFDQN